LVLFPWFYHYPHCSYLLLYRRWKWLLASSRLSVGLFIRMKQVSFYWKNFCNSAYREFLLEICRRGTIFVKIAQSKGRISWRRAYFYDNILLFSSGIEKYFVLNLKRKNVYFLWNILQNTLFSR
jgi:hypothetical protein